MLISEICFDPFDVNLLINSFIFTFLKPNRSEYLKIRQASFGLFVKIEFAGDLNRECD